MRRTRLAITGGLWLLCVLLPAYRGVRAEEGAKKVRVTVYNLPRPGEGGVMFRAQRAVVDAFLQRPGNENVELVPFMGLRAETLMLEVGPLMALAGGIAPDLLYVNFRKSDSYIQEGFLRPLDDFLIAETKRQGLPIDETQPFRDDEVPEILRHRVPKAVWPVIYRAGPDGKKHVWALPHNVLVVALVYRKDLFLEAGLDPEKPPQTWEELYEAARRIHDPQRGIYGIGLIGGPTSAWNFMSFLWSAGAEAITQDEHGEWRAVYDSDAAVLAFDFYRKLIADPVQKYGKTYRGVAYRDADLYFKWSTGRIGMMFNYLEGRILAQINPEDTGIAPVPKGPAGALGSELNCPMMGIAATTTDPDVLQKAWEFLWFFDSKEAHEIMLRVFIDMGYGRFANPVWLEEFGYTDYLRQIPESWRKAYQTAMEHGKPEPYGKNCDLVYIEMSRPLNQIAEGDFSGLTDEQRRTHIKGILQAAAKSTNEKMLGILPPEVERFRKRVALGVAVIICAVFFFVFYRVYQDFTPEWARSAGWSFFKYRKAYLLILPAAALVFLWQYVPLAQGSVIAFQDYKIVRETRFVGLGNFAQVLFDPLFWKYLWNSTYYMLLSIGLCFWPPIFLAILLQEVPRGKILFRVLFYLPAVTTGLVIAFLWKNFFDPSDAGFMNQVIDLWDSFVKGTATHVPLMGWFAKLALGPQRWLQDPKLAMICVMLPQLWAGIGPGCIVYLAALKSIPDDFYEAAEIDGAGFRAKIRHIVIPYLKPLVIINFIGAFIAAFRSANFIFIMTAGGPGDATHVLGYEIWIRSFLYLKFGIGAAMAWILGSLLIGFTSYQLRIMSRLQFKAVSAAENPK
ncbi:MAG TPA: extracellular solute-binding protein [Candidatus Hydrogenedentes bacterium]|nr:extracellular solute-binding protein [Candidatus Hydrogenedentota bacterium]HOL76215.1 extracellular solute-binding protein [Candidatus Hydrogenedentota bacterium]HPO86501.1 extracellular solute-binding protein [Candidatus Hydrogenedentota bacterium]